MATAFHLATGFQSCQTTYVSMLEEVDSVKPFSEGPLNTGAWICFRVLNHAKSILYSRRHFSPYSEENKRRLM
jgi:hypothetical protein